MRCASRAAEVQHAIELRRISMSAPARVIAILLAAAGIAPRRLQMTVGLETDPDVFVCRRNGETADAGQNGGILHFASLRIQIEEALATRDTA